MEISEIIIISNLLISCVNFTDMLTCQEDQQKESYMGDNVFDLDQDVISFTCNLSYSGNIRPRLEWSASGMKLNGTQGTESGIASSSLTLVAKSKFDGANVTCEAFIQGNSDGDVRTGVLWRSDTIRVKCKRSLFEHIKFDRKLIRKEPPGSE